MWSRLDEICEIKGGKRIPRGLKLSDLPTEHVYIRVTDMKNNTVDIGDLKYITDEIYQQIKNYTISSEDLYITIAGTIGRVGTVPLQLNNANLTENAAKLTNIKCVRKYLMFALLSDIAQEHFTSKFHQVAQPKLSIETASKTLIPVPPIKEQRRIVNAVEQIFDIIFELDSSIDELSKSITQCKAKILELAISGKIVPQDPADEPAEELLRRINPAAVPADKSHYRQLPNGWCCCRLGDLMDFQSGLSYTKHDIMPTGIRIIRGGNVKDGRILLMEDDVFISTSLQNEASEIKKGDIIMVASTGSETLIGKTGFADGNYPNSYIGAFLRIIRPKTNVMPQFINLIMNSAQFKKHIRKEAKGSNINNVKKSTVIDFIVPLPPYNEQCRIVEAIESINRRIDDIAEVL